MNTKFTKWKKETNFRMIEYQKKIMSPIVVGYPYWLTIDPSSICNLRCVFCRTGQRRGGRTNAILSFRDFKRIMNKLGPYLYHIDFCNWGEPLINKEIHKMIEYAKRYGPTMKIDTNLGIDLTAAELEALINSGIDKMNISIDGASQSTYEVYRRDGDFGKVIQNLKLLIAKKIEMHSSTPHIHWQFLVFKHNEHEIEKARQMAKEIGVDSIGFTAPFCSPEWISSINEYNNYIVKDDSVDFKKENRMCEWPWDGITVNANGSVSPCCSVEDEKDDFGNIFKTPFWLLWNGRKYRAARYYIRDRQNPTKDNVCNICDHIGASNHARIGTK
jgi:radical SAM protein with 4Fe4S-binding SPASM domain